MARIRTIKPEFWNHAQLGKCSLLARLTFVGLIGFADDDGRGHAEVDLLWGQLHSGQPPNVRRRFPGALSELRRLRDDDGPLVVFYKVAGAQFYRLTGFKRQQRIDKPSPSKLPAPPNSKNVLGALPEHSTLDQGSGRQEGKGEDQGRDAPLSGGPLDHLHRVARQQKIAGRPETIRQYVESWAARVGAAECERMLMESTGKTVMEIQDKYFPRNGSKDPMSEALNKWAKEGGPKS